MSCMSRAGWSAGMFSASKAVPFVLDLRTFHDGESHACEDGLHPVADDRQRVQMAERFGAAGQRDVNGARGAGLCPGLLGVGRPARLNRLLQLVGIAPDVPLLIGCRAAR